VLFVGGSLGAERINELAVGCARTENRGYQILHLCGRRYLEEVRGSFDEIPAGMALVDYEDRMGEAYVMADLVVCRSGSATLAELTAVGRPALLVPSPNVTENHQEENARGLEACGAAKVLVESGWDLSTSMRIVAELVADTESLSMMSEATLKQAKLDAASRAADLVESLLT